MPHIKEIHLIGVIHVIDTYRTAFTHMVLKTFTHDDGTVVYSINNREVTKEELDAQYTEAISSNKEWYTARSGREPLEETTDEYDITYEELIDRLEKSIDPYVEYIDDGKQYREACAHNDKIRKEIAKYKAILGTK